MLFADITVLNADFQIAPHQYVGVRDDKIAFVGDCAPAEDFGEVYDGKNRLLMPALVNAHSHAAMTLLRGYAENLPLQRWLEDRVFPFEDKIQDEDAYYSTALAIAEMIRTGTASFTDMYFFPSATVEAVVEAGVKANLNRCVQCFDEAQTVEQNHQIPESLALFEQYHNAENGRIRIDFSIHAEYTCKSRIVRSYSEMCRERGGRMHLHLAETAREQQECIERYGKTPAEWFESLGTFDSPTAAAHCVAVTESDMDILRAHGVSVVHNPTSNLKLGSGFAPIRRMIDKGINVTLGTDGVASNNNLNMFEEMHLADIIHDGYHNDPTHIKSAEVLDMATVNGAKLQGRDDTGVLEVGKKADIIAVDLTKPHLYPNFDTLALLTCSAQAGDVCMTMADGRILYENGVFLTLDAEKVISDMKAAVARLYR